jgi:hypothetical protein
MKNKKNFLFLVLFLLILVIIIVFVFTLSSRKKNQTTSLTQKYTQELIECTSTANDQPQTISNYKVSLFASDLDLSSYQDTGTRTFSLNALKKKAGGDDIYFQIEKSDGSYITGLRSTIEVCDENNKTSKGNSIKYVVDTPADQTSTSKFKYMHGGFYPHSTGKYRIDAYAEIDGEWKLVGRLADITIID